MELTKWSCPVCGGQTFETPLTPPADARPAFPYDIERIRELADRTFGPGCGKALMPDTLPGLSALTVPTTRKGRLLTGKNILPWHCSWLQPDGETEKEVSITQPELGKSSGMPFTSMKW